MTTDFRPNLFAGRVLLITGAGEGIGAATAAVAGRLGARLAICDRREQPFGATVDALGQAGVEVFDEVLDVRDSEAAAAFVESAAARFGAIDVLVNNAGGSFNANVADLSAKGENAMIAENFTQITHMVRCALGHMPSGGSIINITSVEAHQAAPGYGIYAAMKAAVASLTRTLALELAPSGIRVNAMAPDALDTSGEHDAREITSSVPRHYNPASTPPLGRFGSPEDGANAVLFLASPLAQFITGSTVHVDGGTWAAGGWQRRIDDDRAD
jgi:NAD(P)-dependent dehydrogenase (short-subunit alcohol dehydrogenase family)